MSVPLYAATIGNIEVVGVDRISETLILDNSGLVPGEQFAPALLEEAIKKLYSLGFFSDVNIRGKLSGDRVDLEIEVIELNRVSELKVEGNKELKSKDILEKVDIKLDEFLSPVKAFHAARDIKAFYSDEGYPSAEVETEVIESSPGMVSVTFKIDESSRRKVRSIKFHGNEIFSEKKLHRQMETKEKSLFRSGKFAMEEYLKDLGKIERFYKNEGYISAEIIRDTITIDSTEKWIDIEIYLEENEKYYFGEIAFSGHSIYSIDEINDELTFEKGDAFSADILDESLANVYFLYQEKGYIYADLKDERVIEDSLVNLDITITEGIEAHVRKIEIAGNTRTHDKVIRREMNIYPGDTFKRSKLMRSVRNVYYLNYFGDVVPDFKVLPDGDVDLIMEVEEKPVGRFQIGATANSRDGLVGNISIGWPNMLGRGWEAEFLWEFGTKLKNFSLSFTEPWLLDTPTSVGIDLYNTSWLWSGVYTEIRTGGAIRLGRRLYWPDSYFSIYGRYKLESLEYTDFSSSYNPTPAYDLRTMEWPQLESALRLSIQRDSRDSRMFATEGSRSSYTVEVAGDYLGGDIEYQKQDIRSDWYFKIHKYLTLVAKGRFGILTNTLGDDPEDVPFGERYFLGGISVDGQVRGYTDRSISPIDTTEALYDSSSTPDIGDNLPLVSPSETFRAGGRVMTLFTAELRVPIQRDQLYLSIFSDFGNTWRDFDHLDFSTMKKSVGGGIRLVVPMIGIMGIDAAYGFDKRDGTNEVSGWQWHFQIGPEY